MTRFKLLPVSFVLALFISVTILWAESLQVSVPGVTSDETGRDGKVSAEDTINKEAQPTKAEETVSETPHIKDQALEVPPDETVNSNKVSDKDLTDKNEEAEQERSEQSDAGLEAPSIKGATPEGPPPSETAGDSNVSDKDTLDNDKEIEQTEPDYDEMEPEIPPIKDSFPSFNRAMFTFNDKAFHYFFKPIYTGYNSMVPEQARVSVRNFYTNIKMPVRFFNCLFQANPKGAGTEMLRFVINSTMGVAGFLDPAKSKFHLEKQDRDFGQTLGKYKMDSGTYLVLPIIGPSNMRDTIGLVGDGALNPLTWVSFFFLTTIEGMGNYTYDTVNDVSIDKGNTYESITKPAIDPYIALQDAYTQNRMKKIKESPNYNKKID